MAANHNSKPFSERVFRAFLRLFPSEFRQHFAGEMETVFRDQHRDAQAAGAAAHARFWWDTYSGLVITAFGEHREILFQDVEYALRMMRNDLTFTSVIIIILGLAIGASTAAFMAANAILIQPLPFAGGNHLIHLQQRRPAAGIEDMLFSVKEIEDYRSQSHTLDSVVEFHEMTFSLLGGPEPQRVDTGVVSANFFRVLDVPALYGRTFMDEDDRPDARPVLILSYNFWQKAFGGDRNVVGQKFSMNDKEHVVVGVLPPIPQFPAEVDVYMPTVACPTRSGEHAMHDRNWHMLSVFATLKPGVKLAEAQADLGRIAERLRTTYPNEYSADKGYDIDLKPVHEELAHDIRPVLIVLAAATGLLLLLACANVTGIMLSRMLARTRELTVRTILGASRTRITRSFITEGVLLAACGGVAGLLFAYWSLDVLVRFTSRFTSLASQLQFSPSVIVFCLGLSVICGVVVGLVPALGVRQTPLFTMELGNVNLSSRAGSKARGILIAAQLALSVILLVGAGLTLRSLVQLERIDSGFEPSGVLTARIYVLSETHAAFFTRLLERTRRLPGVQYAALASTVPLHTNNPDRSMPMEFRGRPTPKPDERAHPFVRVVSPDYFHALGAQIIAGRDFTDQDTGKGKPPVVIVNQHLASYYWPNQSALGKQISASPDEWLTVVGVVGDVRHEGLDKDPVDEVYASVAEAPQAVLSIVLRSPQTSPELAQQLAWIVHDIDPHAVLADVAPLLQLRANSLSSRRTTALFLSIFAVVALCITASGIGGMMALSVGERKHEIGVRLALGATPGTVIRSMMGQVFALIVLGLGTGFAAAWLMSTSMSHVIFGVGPRDSTTFVASLALLVAVAAASSFVPLTRIARLDPVVLLRTE